MTLGRLAGLQETMAADRATIREEMEALEQLNKEYLDLQKGGVSLNRDKIAGGLAFIVGLTAAGSALNEAAKMAFSSGGGDPLLIGLNLVLGGVGIGYYFVRTKK